MPLDIDRGLDFLSTDRAAPRWPTGAPSEDFARSPAAARVGALAAGEGLFLFHFEHRAHGDLPAGFLLEGLDPELALAPQWQDGRLAEAKYQSFRHDLMIGSFHPGHRGKWTTHELCHALVGFGWRAGASPLFHATAARLAELLPVVLYYFLDEVRLQRCPDHAGGGPLFREFCPACEAAAHRGPVASTALDREHLQDARRFLDRELAAVARTRREGRPIGHRFGSLDLCTDGLAYAGAHGQRLGSEAFERFAAGFLGPQSGCWSSLDALEARVIAVSRALVEGADLAALADSATDGRWRWTVQDIAWRMIEATLHTPSVAADRVVDALAAAPASEAAVRTAIAAWPLDPSVFHTGYPLCGTGIDTAGLAEGLTTVAPICMELFGDAELDPVGPFSLQDAPARVGLGDRFAAWVEQTHPGPVATLARFEAALRYAGSDPVVRILGEGEGIEAGEGVRALDERYDPMGLADLAEAGELVGVAVNGALRIRNSDGIEPDENPTTLDIARDAAGEVAVVEPDPDDPVEVPVQIELGLIRYRRWRID